MNAAGHTDKAGEGTRIDTDGMDRGGEGRELRGESGQAA